MAPDQSPQPTRTVARLALALAATLLAACAAPPAPTASPPIVSATNRLGMRFVHVPAGEFRMGSDESAQALAHAFPNAERRRLLQLADEAPVHRVKVRGFWIDTTPVTNAQFKRFVKATGHVTVAEKKPDPKDYPGALPELLYAGSLVFSPMPGSFENSSISLLIGSV